MRFDTKMVLLVIAALCMFGAMLGVAAASSATRSLAAPVPEPEPAAATPTHEPVPEPATAPSATPEPTRKPSDKDIDFAALQQKNPDIMAWISVPGTDIDYPVVYRDDLFYLENNVEGQPDKAGAIFLAPENKTNLSDRNTVIYGHNMKNGSMFAQLHKYEDAGFFNENNVIKIYTPQGQYNYKIFAAYEAGNQNLLFEADYTDDAFYEAYQQGILARDGENDNVINPGLGIGNNILTLSTCVTNEHEKRYLVQGVLTDE